MERLAPVGPHVPSATFGGVRSLLIVCALFAIGCAAEAPAPVGPRIAFGRDFEGFTGWRAYALDPEPITEGHLSSANRWLYIDREPPPPGEPFELGTVVVKAVEDGPPSAWVVHAMVKRGEGYNPDGCVDWEFFDLHLDDDQNVAIGWRGTGDDAAAYIDPLSGEARACNSCHVLGVESDYVFSRYLFDEP